DLAEQGGVLDSDDRLRGEGLEDIQRSRGIGAHLALADDQQADHVVPAQQRNDQQSSVAGPEDNLFDVRPFDVQKVGDLNRLVRFADAGNNCIRLVEVKTADLSSGIAVQAKTCLEFVLSVGCVQDVDRSGIGI